MTYVLPQNVMHIGQNHEF